MNEENQNSGSNNNSNSVASVGADAIKAAASIARASGKLAAQDYVGAAVEVAKSSGSIIKVVGAVLAIILIPLIIIIIGVSSIFSPFDTGGRDKDLSNEALIENVEYLTNIGTAAFQDIGKLAVKDVTEHFNMQIDDFENRIELWKNGEEQTDGSVFTVTQNGNEISVLLYKREYIDDEKYNTITQHAVFTGKCDYGIYRLNHLLLPFTARVNEKSSSEIVPSEVGNDGVTTTDVIFNMGNWLQSEKSNVMRVNAQHNVINVEALSFEALCGMATADPNDAQYFYDILPITEEMQTEMISKAKPSLLEYLTFDINAYVAKKIFGMTINSEESGYNADDSIPLDKVVYSGSFNMPMKMPTISSLFGTRTIFGKVQHHNGIDMYAPSAHGDILSIGDGIVHSTGKSSGRGLYVKVKYEDDNNKTFYAIYQHLSKTTVRTGQKVVSGQKIGEQGGGGVKCSDKNCRINTGTSTGHHLHFEINSNPSFAASTAVDPLTILNGKQFE